MNYKRLGIAILVSLVITMSACVVMNDFGVTWDEPIYFAHAGRYIDWLKKPQLGTEHVFFQASPDDLHPPLRKLMGGITHEIFTNQLHIIDNTRGYRISFLIFAFPFLIFFTYFAIALFGYGIGILTPFLFSFLPHVLFLTPLMTGDYAIAVMWCIAIIVGAKGMKSKIWLTVSSILIGFVMLTKLYGFLLFIPVISYWIWSKRRILFGKKSLYEKYMVIRKILYCIIIASSVYYIFWPWLWRSPIVNFLAYLSLNAGHEGVPVFIFGKTYLHAPWWYTGVMVFTTTPIFVLVFSTIGIVRTLRSKNTWDWIFLFNALFPIVFFSLPGVYRYDGVRLFLASFPFICLLSARGMQYIIQSFQKKMRHIVFFIILIFWIWTVYGSIIRIHPWESSYYNELVGGVQGASRVGLESEFWGNAYFGVLPWMNANKKDMMCTYPITAPFYYYQAMGQIESGVVFNAGLLACKYMVVLMRQGMFNPFVKHLVATEKPVYSLMLEGVQLVGVYDIEGKQ